METDTSAILLGGIILEAFLGPIARGEAYLDPGSGSYLLQLVLAALLGSLFVLRTSWGRIKAFFQRKPPEDTQPQEEDEREDDG